MTARGRTRSSRTNRRLRTNMDKLKDVWDQGLIPVVLRRTGKAQRLRVRLPYAETDRHWLQNGRRTSPVWIADKKYWELPKRSEERRVGKECVSTGRSRLSA